MKNQQVGSESEGLHVASEKLPIQKTESERTQRIREVIGLEPVTAFGRRCGIGEATLRKYLNGAVPNTDNLVAIADTANVTIEWLATGRGPKMRGDSAPPLPSEASEEGISQRIRIWRESLGMTPSFFRMLADLPIGSIEAYEAGEKVPSDKALRGIADTGANINWLRTGKGEMRSDIPLPRMVQIRMERITPNSLDIEASESEPLKNVTAHGIHNAPEMSKLLMRVAMDASRAEWIPTNMDDEGRMAIANTAVQILIPVIKDSAPVLLGIMSSSNTIDLALRLAFDLQNLTERL